MDAVKFLKEWRRMCTSYNDDCHDDFGKSCPVPCHIAMDEISDKYIEFTVETVEKWSANYPQKTRLDDLKEKFPNFILKEDGYPAPRPFVFGYCGKKACTDCSHFEKQIADLSPEHCWDLPVEDEK